jgi:hypothetical protein
MADDFPPIPDEYKHGPLPAVRIPKGEYTEQFLRDLEARGEVRPVSDDWNEESSNFPPTVTWVIYPNGDLQRIGYN